VAESPPPTITSRNIPKRKPVHSSAPAFNPVPAPSGVSTASMITAARSSHSSTPRASSRKSAPTCCSANALATIVVEEIESSAPVKMLSISLHPSARPQT
jgi:hypothetical protein